MQASLRGFQNPKIDEITRCFGQFSQEWEAILKDSYDEELRAAVNSIVGNRHKIAHGESVSLTFSSLQQYYEGAKKVIAILQRTCQV